jgi:hypothetical protein
LSSRASSSSTSASPRCSSLCSSACVSASTGSCSALMCALDGWRTSRHAAPMESMRVCSGSGVLKSSAAKSGGPARHIRRVTAVTEDGETTTTPRPGQICGRVALQYLSQYLANIYSDDKKNGFNTMSRRAIFAGLRRPGAGRWCGPDGADPSPRSASGTHARRGRLFIFGKPATGPDGEAYYSEEGCAQGDPLGPFLPVVCRLPLVAAAAAGGAPGHADICLPRRHLR